jgi:ABC-type multidrug transport system permease subunit
MEVCTSKKIPYQFLDLALAKAGIAAGGLSFMAIVGFVVFISLLVTGYVPYTR